MKKMNTITNYQILNLAYNALLEKIEKEEKINEKTKKEKKREDRIALLRLEKYNKQLEEIQAAILEIEEKEADVMLQNLR